MNVETFNGIIFSSFQVVHLLIDAASLMDVFGYASIYKYLWEDDVQERRNKTPRRILQYNSRENFEIESSLIVKVTAFPADFTGIRIVE